MSGFKLEIFDDKPPVLANRYYPDKTIGAVPSSKRVVSRSSYYTPKKVAEAINS
jgi:hypothetical protein